MKKCREEYSLLIACAEMILPWLDPEELANISLTCKALHRISKSITLHRSSDASRGFENLPIPFINTVDEHPYAYFLYTASQILSSESPQRQFWGLGFAGYDSVSRLGHDSASLVVDEADGNWCPCLMLEDDSGGIVSECGPSCRLTQRAICVRLKVVKDSRKGWCLCAGVMIPNGQFVCEYAGELLTTKEARRRQQIYDQLASGGHFSSALLVVREHLPSGKTCLRINIDATRIGDVARFINHSCDGGNLSTILVRSSGSLFPRLCFIASRDIQQDEELTFSYGDVRVRSKGLQCFCGSSCCYGTLPSENT